MNHFIVITGTPGSGKTTLIRELQKSGFLCFDEPARKILAHQRATGGVALPENNPRRFVDLMLEDAIETYELARKHTVPAFFDRGIPDYIAYATLFGLESSRELEAARTHRYNPTVFIAPPWEQIYENDEERKMSFADAKEFSTLIEDAYTSLGYHLVRLPLDSVAVRARFVLATGQTTAVAPST